MITATSTDIIVQTTIDKYWIEWDQNQAAWRDTETRNPTKGNWKPLGDGGYRRRRSYQ